MKEKLYPVVCVLVVLSLLVSACGPSAPAQKKGHISYWALDTSAKANGGEKVVCFKYVGENANIAKGRKGVAISPVTPNSVTADVHFAEWLEMKEETIHGIPLSQLALDNLDGITTDAYMAEYAVPETEDNRTAWIVVGGVFAGLTLGLVADWGISRLTATGGKAVAKEAAEEGLEQAVRASVDDAAEFLARHGLGAGDNLTDDAIEELLQLGRISDEQADLFRQGALKGDNLDDILRGGPRGAGALVHTAGSGGHPLNVTFERGLSTSFYHLDDVGGFHPGLGFLDAQGPTIVVQMEESFLNLRLGPLNFTKATRSGGVTQLGPRIRALVYPIGTSDDVARFAAQQIEHADDGLSLLPTTITRLGVTGMGDVPVELVRQGMTKVPVEEVIRPATSPGMFVPAP